MAEFSTTAVGPFLSVLRTLPVWVLAGLALAGYAVLFIPAFGGIDPTGFRTQWGVWVWIEALVFSVLALAPFHFWPILFFTFPVMVWITDGRAFSKARR